MIRIDIKHNDFYNEFRAEIWLRHDIVKVVTSKNLEELLDKVKARILDYQKENPEK